MRISDQTLNRLALLKTIRRDGPITRSELPHKTGLSSGLISQLTSDLIERGLIVEQRDASQRRGRPRQFLEIAADGAIVVGASLRADNTLTTAFVDLAGKLLHSINVVFDPPATLEALALEIAASLETAIAQAPIASGTISRVGIALPALVDSSRGLVRFMTTFPPETIPFERIISKRINLPVTIENDLCCMARAEHWFGAAKNLDTFTLVHVGYAVGSAEYADGVPRSGPAGLNPEFGHVKVRYGAEAVPCMCGARGCLMMYSSMYGLLLQADRLEGFTFPSVETIGKRFEQLLDDASVSGSTAGILVDEAAVWLGRALANHLNTTDPGTILVSVLSARFLDQIETRVRDVLRENVLPGVFDAADLRFIVAHDGWRQAGTAALALEKAYLDHSGHG